MQSFTEMPNEQPISQTTPVASKAPGATALADLFGSVSKEASTDYISLADQASHFQALQTQNQSFQLKENARIQLLEHPDQAQEIAKNAASDAQQLQSSAYVNKKDRASLNYAINNDVSRTAFRAANTARVYNNRQAEITDLTSLPAFYKAYSETTDPEQHKQMGDQFVSSRRGLVAQGVLEMRQAANQINIFNQITSQQQRLHDLTQDSNATAVDYHQATYSPISSPTPDNASAPADENTLWHAQDKVTDVAARGLEDKVTSPGVTLTKAEGGAAARLPPGKFESFFQQLQGTKSAYANTTSNGPWAGFVNRFQTLSKQGTLSTPEKSEMNYYKKYFANLQNGSYLDLIQKTPLGAQVVKDNAVNQTAVENMKFDEPQDKADWMQHSYNQFITQMESIGHGMGMPTQLNQPVPQDTMVPVKGMFNLNGDQNAGISKLSYLTDQNRALVVRGLKDPQQQAVVTMLNGMIDNADPETMHTYVQGNQLGRNYPKSTDKDASPNAIRASIVGNPDLAPELQYWGMQDNGADLMREIPKSMVNYVSHAGNSLGDPNLTHKDAYIDNITKAVKAGTDVSQGSYYVFDNNKLGLNPIYQDTLANYAIEEAHQEILKHGVSETDYQIAIDKNPLVVTNSPDNRIIVKDINGQKVWERPYTSDMVAHAAQKQIDVMAERRDMQFITHSFAGR